MNIRASLASVITVALVLCVGSFTEFAWCQSSSDGNPAATSGTATSAQPSAPTQDLKSASSDEGKLATVNNAKMPSYSKVYVAPMAGFENYIIAGFRNKKVPLIVVIDRAKADYEISGVSESEKAGWAKMLFVGSQNSNEQASIKVSDLKTGAVIFGYSVHKVNSARGRQSAGEACAKHIKQIVLE
jgi:hypothetical protein